LFLIIFFINPLNAELNPICYLLALLGAHHFLHVSRIRVKHSPGFRGASLWLIPCSQEASALPRSYLQTLFNDLYLIFS